MGTINQSIAWTNGTTIDTAPPSVRAQGTAFRLSGTGLTVNGKSAKSVTVPVGEAEAAFRAAVIAGRRIVKVTRNSRGRPTKSVTVETFAATLRAEAPRKSRKSRAQTPTDAPSDEAPSA